TEEQKGKVYQAVLERATKLEELRAQNLEKTAMLQQSKPIRDNFNLQMKQTLTPEQFAQWEQLKSEKKSDMKDRKGGKKEGKFKKNQEDKGAEKADSLGDID
ncbi:MAG: hypothetical protein K2Q22_02075, partial [Cytophagales bacterium]|nr:hypothetical protein [Cytophagales bacterium]